MLLTAHQPNYWPYPGLIGKIMKSDKFIYLTKVQFEKQSWQKRNRIRTKDGWEYLQVPVLTKGRSEQKIIDVEINNTNWRRKTLQLLQLHYGKAPFYKEYKDFIEALYQKEWKNLCELDIYIMNFVLAELDVQTEIVYDYNYEFAGQKDELLIQICKELNCDEYMSNLGSSAYVKISDFNNNGIDHYYIDYDGPQYQQVYSGYEPNLSILDMLMNCGKEETKLILQNEENYKVSKKNGLIQ